MSEDFSISAHRPPTGIFIYPERDDQDDLIIRLVKMEDMYKEVDIEMTIAQAKDMAFAIGYVIDSIEKKKT